VREAFLAARNALRTAISRAKTRAWEELLEDLDRDTWGRPYRVVLNKLRPATPPATENMDPELLKRVVDTLFPRRETQLPPKGDLPPWEEELGITERKFSVAAKRLGGKAKAAGPDGVPG